MRATSNRNNCCEHQRLGALTAMDFEDFFCCASTASTSSQYRTVPHGTERPWLTPTPQHSGSDIEALVAGVSSVWERHREILPTAKQSLSRK